ncbi:pyrroline-5-carboxylate reductase [Hirschia baltica]|uniref:Pyrroline-5-carboxylate reductase n=1 Tax=Hirschia baltica (strain ATCC 49814 / DSM 5838 / IFAM 1418) TaxID=582402 RepID=C6XP69_HIRBI|nr:pyrroline-5-carboxylate reductase [Hirschia baltica]ACT60249.1 pyrroline-5-carboxylate reductase [Hirschia baltica ATCC 49814]
MKNDLWPVLMVGCGRMGGSIAAALTSHRQVFAYDPKSDLPSDTVHVTSLDDRRLPQKLIIVLAIKPQIFAKIGQDFSILAGPDRVFVSVMAGIALKDLENTLSVGVPIVRAMPNTPASIRFGMTAAIASSSILPVQQEEVTKVFETIGELIWLDKESDLDIATALSGSGPAYFFRFAEAMIEAGLEQGIDKAIATKLVRQTMIGAARLVETANIPLDVHRQQVTSPGGTTAAGLDVLNDRSSIDLLLGKVVEAAAQRSRQLSMMD